MDIVVASDHAGYHLKELIKEELLKKGYSLEDLGAYSAASVDYPDFARSAAEDVATGKSSRGIIICGTGIGVSITANKVPGIRAALCNDLFTAAAAREHNDANILAMGGRIVGCDLALKIVDVFLNTAYAGGRHARRLKKIKDMEECYANKGSKDNISNGAC